MQSPTSYPQRARPLLQWIESTAKTSSPSLDMGRAFTLYRAPGRLDLMGGIADYCGSHVLEMTLDRATWLAFQWREDDRLIAHSLNAQQSGLPTPVRLHIRDFFNASGSLKNYTQIQSLFASQKDPWAGYLLGGLYVLLREKKISSPSKGFCMAIRSDVPLGAGVSSSAALEVAALSALATELRCPIPPLELAALAQKVENRILGAPCGIMDQVAVHCGDARRPVHIHCQPAEILETVPLPDGVEVCGLYTGAKRSTGGDSYRTARTGAFMGLTLLVEDLGFSHLGTYLCNMSPEAFRSVKNKLPVSLTGAEFLSNHKSVLDPITEIRPDETYKIRNTVEHPVYENQRVLTFVKLLKSVHSLEGEAKRESFLGRAGRLMYASNWSYRNRVGLGSPEVDHLVKMLRQKGPQKGIYGAKITGGGGGGTVAVLCEKSWLPELGDVFERYRKESGMTGDLFVGSSEGASHFHPIRVMP